MLVGVAVNVGVAVGATTVRTVSPGGLRPTPATLPAPFVYVPGEAAVTLTLAVHDAWFTFRFPLSATLLPPAVAVTTPLEQVVVATDGLATCTPDGRLSVKDQPLLAPSSVVLVMVKVRVETPPWVTVVGAEGFCPVAESRPGFECYRTRGRCQCRSPGC